MATFIHTPDDSGNIIYNYDSLLPSFNAQEAIDSTVEWIRDTIHSSGGKLAVLGISGGKDSSVAAALCARALGPENVIGVKMADGGQDDWEDQRSLIEHLGIHSLDFDIGQITQAFRDTAVDADIAVPGWRAPDNTVPEDMWDIPAHNRDLSAEAGEADDFGILQNGYELPRQAAVNMPARVRMVVLYMIAQSLKDSARVVGTANLSEAYIGWDTRYGGGGGSGSDILPLSNFTANEVIAMGRVLGLPARLVEKVPSDGLSGKTDEDNFGFTYAQLDDYIRRGRYSDTPDDIREKIDRMHARNEFKMHMPPACPSGLDVMAPRVTSGDNPKREKENEKHSPASIFKNAAHSVEFEPTSNPGMDVTIEDNIDLRDLMAPCPNCHNTDGLSIKCDLASMNALEYWVECDGCGEHWTDRMLGVDYAETKEELIDLWNKRMGND